MERRLGRTGCLESRYNDIKDDNLIIIKVNKIRQDTNKGMTKVLILFDN